MNIKSFVWLFIPPIYYRIKDRIMNMIGGKNIHPLPMISRNSDKVIIIGNGPSLNESIEKYRNDILRYDKICVNFFASTEMYEVLKPNFYVFADNAWFDTPESISDSVNSLFNNIITKTNWPLTIILPSNVNKASIEDRLLVNTNIKIVYYYKGEAKRTGISKFEAWDKNLISPPCQTVLNTCVYIALYWGYPETYLIGADTSFIKDLWVDQHTNELFTLDKHFYKNGDVYSDIHLFDKSARRRVFSNIAEEVKTLYLQFKHYDDLAGFARHKNLKVFNASEYSFIDSFERKKL